jgi:hypothetical protein
MKVKFMFADFSLQPAAPFVQNDSQSFDVQKTGKITKVMLLSPGNRQCCCFENTQKKI